MYQLLKHRSNGYNKLSNVLSQSSKSPMGLPFGTQTEKKEGVVL